MTIVDLFHRPPPSPELAAWMARHRPEPADALTFRCHRCHTPTREGGLFWSWAEMPYCRLCVLTCVGQAFTSDHAFHVSYLDAWCVECQWPGA